MNNPNVSVVQLIVDQTTNELRLSIFNASKQEALMIIQKAGVHICNNILQEIADHEPNGHAEAHTTNAESSDEQSRTSAGGSG